MCSMFMHEMSNEYSSPPSLENVEDFDSFVKAVIKLIETIIVVYSILLRNSHQSDALNSDLMNH